MRFFILLLSCLLGLAHVCAEIVIPLPAGTSGQSVTALPNGNFVIVDPGYDAPGPVANVGAVHLYDGNTHQRISTLTGSTAEDGVGSGGLVVLPSGNFLIFSPRWSNGSATEAGAVTWCSVTTGRQGIVSPANSLVGSQTRDRVGTPQETDFKPNVVILTNGNYVITSPYWANPSGIYDNNEPNAGAVTWGNGETGVAGPVSSSNSLVGYFNSQFIGALKVNNDYQRNGVFPLPDGNYVICSPGWAKEPGYENMGAATWCRGNQPTTGLVAESNSLVGFESRNHIGSAGITLLSTGHYVVRSPLWEEIYEIQDLGAVTWCNKNGSTKGVVTAANSLVGTLAGDSVGSSGVFALSNGNYVTCSPSWDKGGMTNAGAVTLCLANGSTKGEVSASNSLTGSASFDRVGYDGVTMLKNGNPNYIIGSSRWSSNTGAATWMTPTTPTSGIISSANSFVGSSEGDSVGAGIVPLANGHYVLSSPYWDNDGVVDAGAVTWCDGMAPTAGSISAANSIVGTSFEDKVGANNFVSGRPLGVYPLPNGHYVICSPDWGYHEGAVTWANGLGGTVGPVSQANSLIGQVNIRGLGEEGITVLTNSHYVVASPDALSGDGAVAWCSGTGGTVGVVSAANALVGNYRTGSGGVIALSNGHYVVASPDWIHDDILWVGAVTWCDGTTGRTGGITPSNSTVGTLENDKLARGELLSLPGGRYAFYSPDWNHGELPEAGAVTVLDGSQESSGPITAANSILGMVEETGYWWEMAYDAMNEQLIVLRPDKADVAIFVNKPEIDVQQPVDVALPVGGRRDFGAVAVGEDATLEFTVKNLGGLPLTGISASLEGSGMDSFIIETLEFPTSLDAGATFAFHVTFSPTNTNRVSAVLHLTSNDANESDYAITLLGGPTGDLAVHDSAEPNEDPQLTNGSGVLSFGNYAIGIQSQPRVITLLNQGSAALTGISASLSGVGASHFVLETSLLTSEIAPGASTSLTLSFNPLSLGVKNAVLTLSSSDEEDSTFTISLTGQCINPVLPVIKNTSVTVHSHESVSVSGMVDPKGSERFMGVEYGLTKSYGITASVTPAAVTGSAFVAVSATLTGLQPHTQYNARFLASGPLGETAGPNFSFTTGNRPPVASNDTFIIHPGATFLLPLLLNDSDPDDDPLAIQTFSPLPKLAGKVTKSGNSLLLTAAPGFDGASFTYQVKDGFGGISATATVTLLTGTCHLDPPTLALPSAGISYPVSVTATGAWSAIPSQPWISLTPASDYGSDTVMVTLQPNAGKTQRSGRILIGGQEHVVTQAGVLTPSLSMPSAIEPAIVSGDYVLDIPTTNFPVVYKVTNMPPGLSIDGNTGRISGKPTKAGSYEMTVRAGNAAGIAAETLQFTLPVAKLEDGMLGTFHGLVTSHPSLNSNLGSRLELTTTSSGAISGKLQTGTTNTSLKGVLDTDPDAPEEASSTLTVPRKNAPPLFLQLTFSHAEQSIRGTLQDGNGEAAETADLQAWRNGWTKDHRADAFAGLYTFVIPAPSPDPDQPQGFGFGTLKLTKDTTGSFAVVGKLADGSAFTTSSFFGPDGAFLVYQPLYANRGSLFGVLRTRLLPQAETYAEDEGLQWFKPPPPPKTTDVTYPDGFGPVIVQPEGGLFPVLPPGGLILAENAILDFESGGLETTGQEFSQPLTIRNPSPSGKTNKATIEKGGLYNVTLTTFNAATGAFAGKFSVPGIPLSAKKRTVSYQGILVNTPAGVQGFGYFLLPETTSPKAPIESGRVFLTPDL